MNFYILILILILICFVAYRTVHNRRNLIFIIFVIISVGLWLGIQEETEPVYLKVANNTNVTGNVYYDANSQLYIQCPSDQKIQPSKNNQSHYICYKPVPLAHTDITTPQLAAFLYTIIIFGFMTVRGLNDLYSPKIYTYENKYQEELRPISKIADTYRQKGYRWTWSGTSYIYDSRSNDLYVSTDELSDEVDKNFIMKGSLLQVDHQALYIYLKKDLKLMREMLRNPKLSLFNNRIDNFNPKIKIYVNIPLKSGKIYSFLSVKGKYDLTADRFLVTIKDLFRLLTETQESYTDTLETNTRTVNDTKPIAQGTAEVAGAYKRTKGTRVVTQEAYQPQEHENRKEM